MGKGKIIAGTLAGLIMAGGIAGAGYFGYKTIKDRDKTIEDQKTTIGALEDENKISKEKIEQLTKDLSAKVSEIAEKDKQIAEKDNLIEENNHKIQTLNNQKTTLLASVAEIDNKLTSTTDAVDVDNLEARKTAILGQIDTLNIEIANLTAEKTQLEQDVATLTTEKQNLQNQIADLQSALNVLENTTGFVFKKKVKCFSYFVDGGGYIVHVNNTPFNFKQIVSGDSVMVVGDSLVIDVDDTLGSDLNKMVRDLKTLPYYEVYEESYYEYKFNGNFKCQVDSPQRHNFDNQLSSVIVYYNNQVTDSVDFCDSKYYFVRVTIDDNALSLYILDAFLTGKYASDAGHVFDFDNNKYCDVSTIDECCFGFMGGQTKLIFSVTIDGVYYVLDYDADNDCFTYNGEIFTKVSSEETEATVSESNLKMALVGTVDSKQTMLCFNDANYASNLMQKQTSDGDFVCVGKLGFVSWNDSTKTLTLKNNDNNENIVLTNVIITKQPDGSFLVSSGTWDGNFFGC